ncbi:hypothetical protein [Enterococcus faecalis]|uniref:hypothetical protein n=1 Tax=Enterococcus faecalis TaxID=1351 RepID=UPI003DA0E1CE
MKKVCAIYAWKKLVDPKTIMISASVLGMVPSNAPIFTAEINYAPIGLETPDENEFVVHLEQMNPFVIALVSIKWLAPQRQSYVEEKGTAYGKTSKI